MSWIDTSDKIDHDQILRTRVWALVDVIEDRKGMMMHEMPEWKDRLKKYQDREIKPITFINELSKYIDNLENK